MEHLFAMILTAYDPRKNPVAGLLVRSASQTCGFVVQLASHAVNALSADTGDYTTEQEDVYRPKPRKRTIEALTDSGQLVTVDVDI